MMWLHKAIMLAVAVLALLIFFVLLSIKRDVYFNTLKISGIILLIAAQLILGVFVVRLRFCVAVGLGPAGWRHRLAV